MHKDMTTTQKLMSKAKRIWLGLREGKREIFRAIETPTVETHGSVYDAVVGPFRTLRGARFMRDYGRGNPHCRCVADAERLGRKHLTA